MTSGRATGRGSRWALAAILGCMGVLHLLAPAAFERLIPRRLPGSPVVWNRLGAAAELSSSALLARDTTARVGGWAALGTIAGVWVANIQAAIDGHTPGAPGWFGSQAAAYLRVPLQLPLLWWAYRHTGRPAN